MLSPHEWDDDCYRLKIHEAFDNWFVCYMTQPRSHQTSRWQQTLRDLTKQAVDRREANYVACRTFAQTGVVITAAADMEAAC